ncbi:hypothetical protein [Nocardia sp. NPDC049707]|uniref:hypothetical protein n=1 Tax=Nocardia sp. NPDC049707 TaxID=3154735 RepID=UPI00343CC419
MVRRVGTVLMACVSAVAVIFVGYRIWVSASSEQVEISCGPRTAAALYCVYHRTTPGFAGTRYEVIVGHSPGRGLVYGIPYAAEQIIATWDTSTGAVTIAMPGTTLTIAQSEYLDTR